MTNQHRDKKQGIHRKSIREYDQNKLWNHTQSKEKLKKPAKDYQSDNSAKSEAQSMKQKLGQKGKDTKYMNEVSY